MNPWLFLGASVLWVATAACTFWYGTTVGRDGQIAKQVAVEEAAKETRRIAMKGAADAISKIVVRNTTVQGRVETIVRDNPVYRDCVHDPQALKAINEALTGDAKSDSPGISQQ